MRLKSTIWVSAYLRRCNGEGAFATLRRRGAEEAGAIFVKVARLDGTAQLFAPAPQSAYATDHPDERAFLPVFDAVQADATVEERLTREIRFDPDVWVVEVEDRGGRHFLTLANG